MNNQLSIEDRHYIQKKARIRRYDKGWPVVHQGDQPDAFFLILEGEVEVSCQLSGERTLLCRLGPGDSFGELGLVTGNPRTASVAAIKSSKLAVLSKQQFQTCLNDRPSLRTAILAQMGEMITELTEKLNVNAETAYRRLRYFMYKLAQPEGDHLVLQNWNQEDLAQLANCKRETITKTLGPLEQGGWIRRDTNPKRIVILKELPKRF